MLLADRSVVVDQVAILPLNVDGDDAPPVHLVYLVAKVDEENLEVSRA